jgi:hypothetical protein
MEADRARGTNRKGITIEEYMLAVSTSFAGGTGQSSCKKRQGNYLPSYQRLERPTIM